MSAGNVRTSMERHREFMVPFFKNQDNNDLIPSADLMSMKVMI